MVQAADCLNEEVSGKRLGISDNHMYAFLSKYNYKLHGNEIKKCTHF